MNSQSSSATKAKESTPIQNQIINNNHLIPTSFTSIPSKEAFAPTPSKCGNSNSGPSTSFRNLPSTSANAFTPKCSLCSNLALLSPQQYSISNSRLRTLLTNLSKRLKISSDEISSLSNYTTTNFPLCSFCLTLLEQLWKEQQIVDQANLNMEGLTSQIQINVRNIEILKQSCNRPGSSTMTQAEAEQKTCLKLPELILEGYRNVLRSKIDKGNDWNASIQRASLTPEIKVTTGNFSSLAVSREVEVVHVPSFATLPEDEKSDYDDYDNHEEIPASLSHLDITATYNDDDHYDYEDEERKHYFPESRECEDGENFVGSVDPLVIDNGNDANLPIVHMSNAEASASPSIQINREAALPAEQVDEESDYMGSDDDEIYRSTGTRSRPKSLNCGVNKQNSGVPKVHRAIRRTCFLCKVDFPNLLQLRAHKTQHHPLTSFECGICGKPFKAGSLPYNLLIHKFSHKNDEERQIALDAGERGSNNCKLSTKRHMALAGGKTSAKKNQQQPKKKIANTCVSSAALKASEGNTKEFSCNFCHRRFGKYCNLMNHKRTHISTLNIQYQPSPSTSTTNR